MKGSRQKETMREIRRGRLKEEKIIEDETGVPLISFPIKSLLWPASYHNHIYNSGHYHGQCVS
jgi:hypothetical protein